MNRFVVGIVPIVVVLVLGSFLWQDPTIQNLGYPCALTADNAEGPYYIAGAPSKETFGATLEGQRLVVSGQILDYSCNAIPYAIVDVWQTDSNGEYYFDDAFTLRGKVAADENGSYNFETVFPGKYSESGMVRPAHIHLKILSAEDESELLTTQLYFQGDKDHDWLVKPSLILDLEEIDGKKYAEFDFVVRP